MGKYRELMTKYGQVKPIWSTELGLNSQGMTRYVVAAARLRARVADEQHVAAAAQLRPELRVVLCEPRRAHERGERGEEGPSQTLTEGLSV